MAILKPLIQKLWASGGAVVQPSDTKIETGWTAEVPPHQWENWIQNRQDQYLAHINERGIPEWDGNTDYLAGKSYTQGSDGVIYKSVAASGPTGVVQNPTTDATNTYWTPEVAPQSTETERGSLRVGTQAEVNAGSLDTVAVTPSKLRFGFQASLTTNGYIKFPAFLGGIVIQWGRAESWDGGTPYSFPVAFPTAVFALTFADGAVDGDPLRLHSVSYHIGSLNTTGFTPYFKELDTEAAVASGFSFIAIGH